MTETELITNFVNQYSKPFTVDVAVMLTGIAKDAVTPILKELEKQKRIKRIYEKPEVIYVRNNRYNTSLCATNDKWNLNLSQANELLNLLEKGRYTSLRDIATEIGRSRQWVYIYLEALASIECIDLRGYVYVVVSRKNLPKLGTKINKGILGDLRSLNRLGGYRDLREKPKKTKLKTDKQKRSASPRTFLFLL